MADCSANPKRHEDRIARVSGSGGPGFPAKGRIVCSAVVCAGLLAGCSILPFTDEQETAAPAAEAAAESSDPAFQPVSATLPSASELGRVTITYPAGNADLPETVSVELDRLADQLAPDDDVRVELHAYAQGDEDDVSRAKLFSLKRGMRVRSYLYEKGVEPRRVLLRPLGIESGEGPPDRVDIVLLRDVKLGTDTRIALVDPAEQQSAEPQPVPEPAAASLLETLAPVEPASEEATTQTADAVPATPPTETMISPRGEEEQAQPASPEAEPVTSPEEPTQEAAGPETEPVAGDVIPQGGAAIDPSSEGSLVARFEAIAVAEVQLAGDPDLQATIERKGGTVTGAGETAATDLETVEEPPALVATQETGAKTPGEDGSGSPSPGESAMVSQFLGPSTESSPESGEQPEPSFEPAPNLAAQPESSPSSNPAVTVATGDAFEAAIAGSASSAPAFEPVSGTDQAASATIAETVPATTPETTPSIAALPPAGTLDTGAEPDGEDTYVVQFELDSPDMTPGGHDALHQAIGEILARPTTRVKIVAHADSSQSDEFVLALSTIRRNEVENALRNSGIHWGRIWSKAVGDRKPRVPGATGTRLAENNVVEIVVKER